MGRIITVKNLKTDEVLKDTAYELFRNNESFQSDKTDGEGKIKQEDLVPGKYSVLVKKQEEENNGE